MIDAYNDPYQERTIGIERRRAFEKLKKTNGYLAWRSRQVKIQSNRCAWCKINLDRVVVHVDHVTPLRFGGINDFTNLVLSCRRCNLRKYIANNRVVPQWIKDRDSKLKQKQKLSMMRKQQKQQCQAINDEIILEELSWIV